MEKTVMPASTTINDILRARRTVYKYLHPTPLHHYPSLSRLVGTDTWIKHENHQPVGAFKVRGGLHLAAGLSEEQKQGGLYTASTGNHGQSIAFAARAFGIAATIAVPEGANRGKIAAMEGLGAKVITHGEDFDTAREWINNIAEERGGYFVGPTDEPLIQGVGTYGLEIMEDLPEADVIIVPVGAGSGVCGTAIAAKTLKPEIKIIGAQSAQAPTQQTCWQSGIMQSGPMATVAEGLATRVPFANTQTLMRNLLDDFILVEDSAIEHAVYLLLEHTHNIAEEAGAASLAAALQIRQKLEGKKTVLVISGGNIAPKRLQQILMEHA
ncbi:MAG: threonine ammonia-lyase [Desulfobulbus sp.]|nr:MAG: threonine ammonia-lyase [Desulfobulbus sp.]